MKKSLFITLMVLALIWGLFECQEARADHWTQIATLLPGTYMLVGTDLEQCEP